MKEKTQHNYVCVCQNTINTFSKRQNLVAVILHFKGATMKLIYYKKGKKRTQVKR